MKLPKGLSVALAMASGFAGVALAAMPAQAAGDTGRTYGCAAHWRNTANWNECVNAPGVNVQLQVNCKYFSGNPDYYGPWHFVRGTRNPVSRYECQFKTEGAWNAFRF